MNITEELLNMQVLQGRREIWVYFSFSIWDVVDKKLSCEKLCRVATEDAPVMMCQKRGLVSLACNR